MEALTKDIIRTYENVNKNLSIWADAKTSFNARTEILEMEILELEKAEAPEAEILKKCIEVEEIRTEILSKPEADLKAAEDDLINFYLDQLKAEDMEAYKIIKEYAFNNVVKRNQIILKIIDTVEAAIY